MKFLVYKDARKEWRWRLSADNYKVIATSGEGYKNRGDCVHAIDLVVSVCESTVIIEFESDRIDPSLSDGSDGSESIQQDSQKK